MRRAAEANDVDGVMSTFADDVILRSPITERVVFRGTDDVRAALREVFAVLEGIEYIADLGDSRTRALFYRSTVGGRPLEEAMRVQLDEAGAIEELTIFYRPLPGLVSFAAALAPRVARSRKGAIHAVIARVLMAPLALAVRLGDRVLPWFV